MKPANKEIALPTPDRRSVLDLRANGLAASITRSGFVTGGASSTVTRGYDEPRHLRTASPDSRAICTPGCALFNHRQRFATTWTVASPAAAFGSGVGLIQRRRRHGDHGMSGKPAASCTIRFGSAARFLRWRSALALPQSAISASERPQPVQRLPCPAILPDQVDLGAADIAVERTE